MGDIGIGITFGIDSGLTREESFKFLTIDSSRPFSKYVKRETEKAYLLTIDVEGGEVDLWIPKKAILIDKNDVCVAKWFKPEIEKKLGKTDPTSEKGLRKGPMENANLILVRKALDFILQYISIEGSTYEQQQQAKGLLLLLDEDWV